MSKSFEKRLKKELKNLLAKNLFREPITFNKNFLNLATNDYFLLRHNRKLLDGPGNNMYGLEVCKSLHLPDDFLDLANTIRNNKYGEENILLKKKSHYNSKKLKGKCELCGNTGIDIHHLMPQHLANNNGFIKHFHKNHKSNLANICKTCHLKETKLNTKRRKTKTTKGIRLVEE